MQDQSHSHICSLIPMHKLVPQSATTFVYQAKLAKILCNVYLTWCKRLTNHDLTITIDKPSKENYYTCKIDLKNTQCWGKKGLKSFDIVEGTRVDIFWDFRQAKFSSTSSTSSSSEPCSDYYVALVHGEEAVLLVGDLKSDAYKRTRSRPCSDEATLLHKKENVCGKRLFCTKAMLNYGSKRGEHDIVIENSLSGPGDPEMWISIEGTVVIRIMNLNWRFRGNETIMVNNVPMEIFWDVHDWLFSSPESGHGIGLFIFKLGTLEEEANATDFDSRNFSDFCCNGTKHDHVVDSPKNTSDFCHFLYAWKVE
ncbi:uncharacterized protein LOC133786091 [Humulus lupulus]|uniref:uncharacterized protein LOC133786091 n=1 Tax=Humulus lupulus TaxID=3486 RepID=UPI002B41549A|nr:uncharacterized protein LOC133786091 [Humulus lupulus]